MILLDNKNKDAYSNVSKAAASRIIGVSISTIYRWSKVNDIVNYHHWVLYFKERVLKQRKGFAIKPKME